MSDIIIITVKRLNLAAIIFGGFSNMAIWRRFNLAVSNRYHIFILVFGGEKNYYFSNTEAFLYITMHVLLSIL